MLALVVVSAGHGAAAAAADPTVVSATIYQGSGGGGVTSPSVTLSTLENNCPPYSGSSPMYLYPSGQPYQPATNSSWALSTILTCGLQVPLADLSSVQVDNPQSGFETPLSRAQLSDPSQFHDPAAPTALPVISSDGGEDQNTYTRPWLGGTDDNASDHVVQTGAPIALVVYENGAPLQVTAASNIASATAGTMSVNFSATVQGSDGAAVPASALTWSWSFGDSTTSTEPTPVHSYPTGDYFVTVQVTDASAGLGGTATIKVSAPPTGGSGATPNGGKQKQAKSSTGTKRGGGTQAGGPTKQHKSHQPGTSGQNQGADGKATGNRGGRSPGATTPGRTTTPAGPGTAGSPVTPAPVPTPPPPVATPTQRRPAPRAPVPTKVKRPPAPTTSSGPLVTGRLISAVTPLPPSASPLVHALAAPPATAPAVRRGSAGSSLAAIGAGLAIVLLLGLGAARELSWPPRQRRWRPLGFGS